jgi:hypothetical protein
VRAYEEASFGDQSSALTKRGLPDGVAEDDGRDGRPGGSNTLADPGDPTTREPDPLDEAADLTSNPARHVFEHGSTVLSSRVMRLNTTSDSDLHLRVQHNLGNIHSSGMVEPSTLK